MQKRWLSVTFVPQFRIIFSSRSARYLNQELHDKSLTINQSMSFICLLNNVKITNVKFVNRTSPLLSGPETVASPRNM